MTYEPPETTGEDHARRAPAVWGNIPPRNPDFTGRDDLLARLHGRLLPGGRTTAVLPHALHGMGGVGKSLLTVEYVYRQMTEYDVVWWISAERTAQIFLSLVQLAPRLGIVPGNEASSAVTAVLESLRIGKPYAKWLLVFDNAESPEAVQRFFPTGGPGNILITSRNPQWASIASPLEVDVFLREESRHLLRLRGPEISDEDSDRIAEELGDLPLAIEQAGAWLAETGMAVDEYLRLLKEKRVDLLRGTVPLDNSQPVIAAWNISMDQLETKNLAAYKLLQICSFYAPEAISRALFARMPRGSIAPELDAAFEDPIRLAQVIREIGRYSLARFNHRNRSLQIHRLVQAALQYRMTEEDRAVIRRAAHLLLAASDPHDPNDVAHWERYSSLYPHVLASEAIKSDESRVRDLVVNETIFLLRCGEYDSCLDLARTAHETWSEMLGEDHPQTLQVARWLGFVLFTVGAYPEAAKLNSAVLKAYRRTIGPEAQDTIDALGNVAVDHRVRGAFGEALALSRSVHEQYLRLRGPDHPETLRAAHNVGVSLRLVGDFTRAHDLDEQTWRSYGTLYGLEHVKTLNSALSVAVDLRELGEYTVALAHHQQLYEQACDLVGRDNPLALSVLRHVAVALRQAGKYDEALSVAEQAQTRLIRRYGPDNPESTAAALELTVNLRHGMHTGKALALGTEVWHRFASLYGHHHPHTLSAALSLANTYQLQGDATAAQLIGRAAEPRLTSALSADHPCSLTCQLVLASCHYSLGELAAALELDTETLERSGRVFGPDHAYTLACAANLAMDLQAVGRVEESDRLRARTVERLKHRLGGGHPAVGVAADPHLRMVVDVVPMPL